MGRALLGTLLMGSFKEEGERTQVTFKGNGILGAMQVQMPAFCSVFVLFCWGWYLCLHWLLRTGVAQPPVSRSARCIVTLLNCSNVCRPKFW